MIRNKTIHGILTGLFVLSICIVIAGCGPKIMPPYDKISNAEMAVNRAREANAIVYAPLDLKLAEEKLENAKKSMSHNAYLTANREAEESLIDAEAAEAKSKAEKAKELSKQMQDNIDSLRQELERTP